MRITKAHDDVENGNGTTPPQPQPTDGESPAPLVRSGVLEILPDGWGFLRHYNFDPNSQDIYVAQAQIKRFGLKTGDTVTGQVRPPKDTEKYYGLLRVETVNGISPEAERNRVNYVVFVLFFLVVLLFFVFLLFFFTARV